MKKTLKLLLIVLCSILALVSALIIYLSVTEYRPDSIETVSVNGSSEKKLAAGDSIELLSFNIGYASLSETEDFFMDGGKSVAPQSVELVENNLDAIIQVLAEHDVDFYLIQEIDRDSQRSFHINEFELIAENIADYNNSFALNYKCDFVPFPLPFIGKVDSGIASFSRFSVTSAERHSLPNPFAWPVRLANLKRCFLVQRTPVEGSTSELIIINTHLEAYESGEGRAAQTAQILDFVNQEYAKGNYVVVGGDFNQSFPNSVFPRLNEDYWWPPPIDSSLLDEGLRYVSDSGVPTCRLLNEPYISVEKPQYYIIDGFLVSPNLTVEANETFNLDFKNSDHNPVYIKLTLN